RSLAYCAGEVEAAAERWRRAFALGAAEEDSGTAVLETLASALERAHAALGSSGRPLAAQLAQQMREKASEPRAEVSVFLVAAEKKLLRALARDLGEAATARLG